MDGDRELSEVYTDKGGNLLIWNVIHPAQQEGSKYQQTSYSADATDGCCTVIERRHCEQDSKPAKPVKIRLRLSCWPRLGAVQKAGSYMRVVTVQRSQLLGANAGRSLRFQ